MTFSRTGRNIFLTKVNKVFIFNDDGIVQVSMILKIGNGTGFDIRPSVSEE